MATTTATQIQQLYVGLLGRAADQGGLNWWADQVTTGGKTLEDVRASFVTSTEYTTTYGAAATRADLVTSIYQNLFERTPSADEVKYWAETDTRPADQLVAAFIEFAGAADQAVINNKTFVAQTYTDTAGAAYNPTAGAAVISKVDSTPASVTAAIGNITNGTLPGAVVGQSLINAKVAADKAVVDFGKSVAAAKASYDTDKNGSVSYDELTNAATGVIKKLTDARTTDVSAKTTAVLKGDVTTAAANLETAKAAVTKVAATVSATAALDGALAAQATTAQKLVNTAALEAAKAGILATFGTAAGTAAQKAIWASLDGKLTTDTAITDAASLLLALNNAALTAGDRAILVAEVKAQLGTYGADLVTAADQAVVIAKADTAVNTAKTNLDTALVSSGAAANATDAAVISKAYTDAITVNKNAAETLTKAETADKAIVDATAVKVQYDAVIKVAVDAGTALSTAAGAGGALAGQVIDLKGGVADVVATAKAETFYFSAKDAAFDHAITGFGAGDSILLGSAYTFNSGALSTGNGNALEFFFVKTATGTNVVVETTAAGSASHTVDAVGAVIQAPGQTTDNVSVITLTGVSVDHLSVANGVISYV